MLYFRCRKGNFLEPLLTSLKPLLRVLTAISKIVKKCLRRVGLNEPFGSDLIYSKMKKIRHEVGKGWCTYDVMKIVFKTPHPLSIYVQNSSTPLTLYVEFQTNSPFPSLNDNQSIKRKHDPRMTILCCQVLLSGPLSLSV